MSPRHVRTLLREVDQLDAALARLEAGLVDLAAETTATADLLNTVRAGTTATAHVHRLPVFGDQTRRHDRRRIAHTA